MKTNARKEFLTLIAETEATVLWAKFFVEGNEYCLSEKESCCKEHWGNFLNNLDFEYNSGYGSNETSGAVMFSDGNWAEREEYDGASDWAMRIKPNY